MGIKLVSKIIYYNCLAIEDLCILSNGILLSCSYDKFVIAWAYQKEQEIERFEKKEQLRCMDYIDEQGKLFVGTNSNVILTVDISHLLQLQNWQDASTIKHELTASYYPSPGKTLGKMEEHDMDDMESIAESEDLDNKPSGELQKLLDKQKKIIGK